jgi:hypothetical protein
MIQELASGAVYTNAGTPPFDERLELEALVHNRTTLARLADNILDAPREERRRLFAETCSQATEHYGAMGKLSMVTKPKPQLLQWAFV